MLLISLPVTFGRTVIFDLTVILDPMLLVHPPATFGPMLLVDLPVILALNSAVRHSMLGGSSSCRWS